MRDLKYETIKHHLIRAIEQGQYLPDAKLPSESELSHSFHSSHITVRKAMADLVSEGRVYRVQGKGSFVSPAVKAPANGAVYRLLVEGDAQGASQDSSIAAIVRGISMFLTQQGVCVHFEFMKPETVSDAQFTERLRSGDAQGALLFLLYPEAVLSKLKGLDQAGFPYVLLDRCARSYQTNYAASNNIAGGYMQVEYLARRGHRKIVFVASNMRLNTEQERYMGYRLGMADCCAGEPARMLVYGGSLGSELRRLTDAGDLTALAAVNDVIALHVLHQLKQEGIAVPDGLSLVGFDDWEPARYVSPALTTVRQDFVEIGRQAAQLLHEAVREGPVRGKTVQVPVSLAERASVCPPAL